MAILRNGYEGTGRALSLKLIEDWQAASPSIVSGTPLYAHKKFLNSSETLNFLKFFCPIQTLEFFLTAFPDYSGDLSWGGFGRSGDLSWNGS